jgi:hypothetical protein
MYVMFLHAEHETYCVVQQRVPKSTKTRLGINGTLQSHIFQMNETLLITCKYANKGKNINISRERNIKPAHCPNKRERCWKSK